MRQIERMQDLVARGMQPVTSYAPARILLLGLAEAVFGLLVLGMGAVAIWATSVGEMRPTKPGDMPEWWMYFVGSALALGGLALFASGLGRMLSALARNCFFMAGPEGIMLRMPKQGWFGRFRMVEYDLSGIRSRNSFAIFTVPTRFQWAATCASS